MHTDANSYRKATGFLKKAISVARGSGFRHMHEGISGVTMTPTVPTCTTIDAKSKRIDSVGGEFATTIQRLIERGMLPLAEPALIYCASNTPGKLSVGLHIIGSKHSIAEALVIKTAMTIAEEVGLKNSVLFINSIGDRDSSAKFARESGNYLRKNAERIPPAAVELLKEDVFLALEYLGKKRHPVYFEIPRPYEFLTSASRRHLREVLEFVERNTIPYEIDDLLIGHRDCYNQTIFEIRGPENKEGVRTSIGLGGRYDEFPRRLFKIATPGVGIVFTIPTTDSVPGAEYVPKTKKSTQTKLCFVSVGFEARIKSLMVIDTMRRAHIPFYHNLHYEKLTDQMRWAESLSVPYTLIMGHKEALESSVIVRNAATRAQECVPIGSLPDFLGRLRYV